MQLAEAIAVLMLEYYKLRHKDAVPVETESETRDRITMIGEQSVKACDEEFPASGFPGGLPREACVALIATTAEWESGLWRTVHSGEKLGPASERCLVQVHRKATAIPIARFRITKEEWLSLPGLDPAATLRCLRVGVRIHGYHFRRCGLKWRGIGDSPFMFQKAFAEYHLPGKCLGLAPQAYSRSHYTRNLLNKINALMSEPSGKSGYFLGEETEFLATTRDLFGVEHIWVKELPSLLGPSWGLQTPPGLTHSHLNAIENELQRGFSTI